MKYLILGSSGQIGASLTQYLRAKGHEVFEFDIVNSEDQDLRFQNNQLYDYMNDCDFVFFLAFDVGGSRYLEKYQHTYNFVSNNIKLMDRTFDLLRLSKTPFIFASSQMSNMAHSPYGSCKAIGEVYTRILNGLIVKFWNVYGIESDLEKSHVITDFILKAKNNKKIDMLTDGEESREFLYVEDACECLEILSKQYDKIPRRDNLHITNGNPIKIIEIAQTIQNFIPCTITVADKKDTVQMDKKNKPSAYIFNYWQPKTTIREGIKKIIEGMK